MNLSKRDTICARMETDGSKIEDAKPKVIPDGLKLHVSEELSSALVSVITQSSRPISVNQPHRATLLYTKIRVVDPYQNLISRISRSNTHVVWSEFHKKF